MVEIREFKAVCAKGLCSGGQCFEENTKIIDHLRTRLRRGDRDAVNRIMDDKLTRQPALYLYKIDYVHPIEKTKKTMRAFVALLKVEPLNTGQVFGHELVFQELVDNMRGNMEVCGLNFNPIMAMYEDGLGEDLRAIKLGEPLVDTQLGDKYVGTSRHRIWPISHEPLARKIKSSMRDKSVIIADGHHRYAVAEQMNSQGPKWIMTIFVDEKDPGLLLFPFHRALKNYNKVKFKQIIDSFDFTLKPVRGRDEMWRELKHRGSYRFGLYERKGGKKQYSILEIDTRRVYRQWMKSDERVGLGLKLLHQWLIDEIQRGRVENMKPCFIPEEAEKAVDEEGYELAIFVKGLEKQDVGKKSMEEKRAVPQKATCFLPKTPTGTIMWRIEGLKK